MATRLRAAAEELRTAKRKRDDLIVEASLRGMTRRQVAEAVGLTASRVQHIVTAARQSSNGSGDG